MKSCKYLIRFLVLPTALLIVSCQTTPLPPGMGDAQCGNIAEKGYINILTINLLFSEVDDRNDRLKAVAKFAANNDVDILMLQEVVNGVLVKTDNSAQDLRDILSKKHNLDYNIQTAFEIGLPGLLAVANAVLSRCEIRYSLVQRLPKTPEIEFEGLVIEVSRNVLLSRLEIPEFGKINVYNTHLCADCEEIERLEQIERVINTGFIDAYAEYIIAASGGQETLDTLCEDEDSPDQHCTVGVSELNGSKSRRKDYIFARGFADVLLSKVVFNTLINPEEPTASDHAGVFVRLGFPFDK